MEFADLLKELGERIGGGLDLTPDDSGVVTLSVDDVRVMIIDLDEMASVAFYSSVAVPPPEEHLERLYQAVLEANHAFSSTTGATLSLNHETGEIYLCRALPVASLDVDTLAQALEDFVNVREKWARLVTDFRGESIPAETSAEDAPAEDGASFGAFMQV